MAELNEKGNLTITVDGNEEVLEKDDLLIEAAQMEVSSEYNSKVFRFANAALRKLMADIQIEEQNHAEMLYKYKTANGMA